MGKLTEVNGYVRLTLDKLEGIRGDLVRTDDDWRDWKFPQLVEALQKWTERNPSKPEERNPERCQLPSARPANKSRSFQAKQTGANHTTPKPCVYCDSVNHKPSNCNKIISVSDRKEHLAKKQLCYNCTGTNHKAAQCRCTITCQVCNRRHHTSICDKPREQMPVATEKRSVIYPVVIVEVEGIKCRALLDTGAGSSYASAALLDRLHKRAVRKEFRRIEMMMQATSKEIEVHDLTIRNTAGDYTLNVEVTKVDRGVLLSLDNPKYERLTRHYSHLQGVEMEDNDKKAQLPVHLILGASEYTQIKTRTSPKIGNPGEPIAELTQLGWTIMSPGKEVDLANMLLTQTSVADYEDLCRLDVLGLEDHRTGDQRNVYKEFQEQLGRNQEGYYETGLLWKANHPPLANNEAGSLRRLDSLVKRLQKQPNLLERYDTVIQDQLTQGIVERVQDKPAAKEFYIPHKAVVRDAAESTKLRIVYDASARPNGSSPSLNECLEPGPPLQNKLWSVIVRNRFHPVALAGDLKQAFLQIRIRETDRDVMRFHWLKDLVSKEVETLRFTRALFGLAVSPFLLGGVIDQHLQSLEAKYPEGVDEIRKSFYVDDLISGGETITKAQHLKGSARSIFGEAKFELHKWHSNVPALESEEPTTEEIEQSYAKEQLGGVREGETKLLGMPWNKESDTIEVSFPETTVEKVTKREILATTAKIYDPLGLVSPVTLVGKMLYRQACDMKFPWDQELPSDLRSCWKEWEKTTEENLRVPRSLVKFQEPIQAIDLHAFGDTSQNGVSTAVYAVVIQESGENQGLISAKSRLAKKGLTIPRLELVAGHMSANLLHNVMEALQGFPIREVYSWLDSTVALHWIKGNGDYRQFVQNRVHKIQEKSFIKWGHVTSEENLADLGSRGGRVNGTTSLWLRGPAWLPHPDKWPTPIVTSPTAETQTETKIIKEVLCVTVKTDDELDLVMRKWDLWKAIRICSWVMRFARNCRAKRQKRITGPITTQETTNQLQFWVRRSQISSQGTSKFDEDKLQLNLQENANGILECRGRIQGDYPIYLPDDAVFTAKLVIHSHIQTLHGGVGLTMANVRERYWVPRLRSNVEVTLNNRPLSYVEDDIQLPILTPNLLQFGQPNLLPEAQSYQLPNPDLRKRARYLARCKDVLWGRWSSEYLRGLREQHNMKYKQSQRFLARGDVVIIKGDEKNRGLWKLGIVEELITGRDGVTRGARLRAGKSYLERPIQHLYPLELSCDRAAEAPTAQLNAEAPVFRRQETPLSQRGRVSRA